MSVTAFPPLKPTSWRVYRAWDGKRQVHQHYVPFGRNKSKSRQLADQLDERLAERQRAFQLRLEVTGDKWINDDGTITGLQRRTRRRGNTISDLFIIQASSISERKQVKKEFSISALGFDRAFANAIATLASSYGIHHPSLAFDRLTAARSAYEQARGSAPHEPGNQFPAAPDALERALARAAAEFRQMQSSGAIRNRY